MLCLHRCFCLCEIFTQGVDVSVVSFVRASESKNVWIGITDEASEGDYVNTEGSPGNKTKNTTIMKEEVSIRSCLQIKLSICCARWVHSENIISTIAVILFTVCYLKWGDDQPNNWAGNQNCVHLWRDGKWNDFGCDRTDVNGATLYYLCEAGKETIFSTKCPLTTWFETFVGNSQSVFNTALLGVHNFQIHRMLLHRPLVSFMLCNEKKNLLAPNHSLHLLLLLLLQIYANILLQLQPKGNYISTAISDTNIVPLLWHENIFFQLTVPVDIQTSVEVATNLCRNLSVGTQPEITVQIVVDTWQGLRMMLNRTKLSHLLGEFV